MFIGLCEIAVSLACRVGEDGRIVWWLTRESGKVAKQCGVKHCSGCCKQRLSARSEMRRSCMVVLLDQHMCKVEDWAFTGMNCCWVAVSRLSVDSILFAMKELVPAMRTARCIGEGCEGDGEILKVVCEMRGKWRFGYSDNESRGKRWSLLDRYQGERLWAGDGTSAGLTDAVGKVGVGRKLWLRCVNTDVC